MGIIDGSGDVSDVGDMVSFAGMATLGHIRGRGPTRSVGRDEVGTCSDEAARNLLYRRRLRDIKNRLSTQPVFSLYVYLILECSLDLLDCVCLDYVADLDVVVALDVETAVLTHSHFLGVVLESLE